jgi:PhnB protein
MTTLTANTTAEAEIRDLMNDWLSSVRAADVKGIVAHYAPDILAFDAIAKLQFKGVDSYRKHWEACLAMCPGPMVFEVHDLGIVADRDVAFAHGLCRCGAKDESGEEKTSWMRFTTCYRRTSGSWKIVHEHFSAPFDVESGKALFDLKP